MSSEKTTLMSQLEFISPDKTPTSFKYRVAELVSLVITTVILVITFILNGLAASPNSSQFGFANSSTEVSSAHCVEITPAGWTFAIWGIIYTWQALWVLYGWSFVFRPSFPRPIFFLTYILFTFSNICNIVWIYLWGNDYVQVGFAIIAILCISLYATVTVQAIWLYRATPTLLKQKKYWPDLYITRFLVLNGILMYSTWLDPATQLNFTILLQDYTGVDGQTAATVGLSILTVLTVTYFILENTILDCYFRFAFIAYPVLIWAFAGILSAHWDPENDRCGDEISRVNPNFTLALLILSIVLFAVRIVLWILFARFRPLFKTSSLKLPKQ